MIKLDTRWRELSTLEALKRAIDRRPGTSDSNVDTFDIVVDVPWGVVSDAIKLLESLDDRNI